MVVYKLKLLTSEEKELLQRFLDEPTIDPEIEDLWFKYNGPLIGCLDQRVGRKLRRDLVESRCPIEKFHVTLGEFVHKETPTDNKIKFDYAQLLALERLLNDFTCGFECPCCPATIMGKV